MNGLGLLVAIGAFFLGRAYQRLLNQAKDANQTHCWLCYGETEDLYRHNAYDRLVCAECVNYYEPIYAVKPRR